MSTDFQHNQTKFLERIGQPLAKSHLWSILVVHRTKLDTVPSRGWQNLETLNACKFFSVKHFTHSDWKSKKRPVEVPSVKSWRCRRRCLKWKLKPFVSHYRILLRAHQAVVVAVAVQAEAVAEAPEGCSCRSERAGWWVEAADQQVEGIQQWEDFPRDLQEFFVEKHNGRKALLTSYKVVWGQTLSLANRDISLTERAGVDTCKAPKIGLNLLNFLLLLVFLRVGELHHQWRTAALHGERVVHRLDGHNGYLPVAEGNKCTSWNWRK